ncbi:MAG: TrmH family RNA methyltransferase, partial [Actinobacteria bacterium]|nr:TrmH family RNA methyltransferase [Actinomycetota bacterium]
AGMTVALEGLHAVKHALRFAPRLVASVVVRDLAQARALAHQLAPDIADQLLALATTGEVGHPTGVEGLAVRPPEARAVLHTRTSPLVLLDGPRHPGNAGAVIRVAAAAGASGVALTGRLDPWHPAVVRGSAGLHFALPVLAAEPHEVTGPLLVLDADGDRLADVPDDAVLVVGSERAGVGNELRSRAAGVVRLPMREGVSSLNLATAAAAVLYSWRLRKG